MQLAPGILFSFLPFGFSVDSFSSVVRETGKAQGNVEDRDFYLSTSRH